MAWRGRVLGVAACVVVLLLAATASIRGAGTLSRGLRASAGTAADASKGSASQPSSYHVANTSVVLPSNVSVNGNHGQLPANSFAKRGGANDTVGYNGTRQHPPTSAFNRSKHAEKDEEGQEGAKGSGLSNRCLCLFGLNRVLTGLQGDTCGGRNRIIHGIRDYAYGGSGPLTLSALGVAGVDSTFCNNCELGIVTAGSGGGDRRKRRLAKIFNGRVGYRWSKWPSVSSPIVASCPGRIKDRCAESIRGYYRGKGKHISKSKVYLFDDKGSNVRGFQGSGMNAVQVSCDSRDHNWGACGARPCEIRAHVGILPCI